MKKNNKNFLWILFVFLSVNFLQNISADENSAEQASLTMMHSRDEKSEQSFISNVSNYFGSTLFIDRVVGFSMQATLAVGVGLLFLWLKQQRSNIVDNPIFKIYYPGDIATKLADVAGLSAPKEQVQDIISYLNNPQIYHNIGAKVPKGILMNGDPGNGKTLLAKAVAGEVSCPFISISGSSFAQMFVGVGAMRVRELFATARNLAVQYQGCIIFIDEIDSLTIERSPSGRNPDYDQTLNALLAEMDGLDVAESPVIVLAATNRAHLMDEAIKRPGRFDRIVQVGKPKLKDRVELINMMIKKIICRMDINVAKIARFTGGFSGAELVNLMNEAAIIAVNNGKTSVAMEDIELAFDNITLGYEIKGMMQTSDELWKTAIHEAGHTIALLLLDKKYALHKVSITSRSNTLGVMRSLPLYQSYDTTQDDMMNRITIALAGRFAEEVFGMGLSQGAYSDLRKANSLAYDMVVMYGMSEDLRNGFYNKRNPLLTVTANKEVKKIIDVCTIKGKKLIVEHKNDIEKIAKLLIEKGTVLGNEIYDLLGIEIPKGIEFSLVS